MKDYEGIIGDCLGLDKRVDKRDEIKVEIADILGRNWGDGWEIHNKVAIEIIKKLDSMGVVIKTDRELPHYTGDEDYKGLLKSDIYLNAQDHMIKAGFGATERLIKE